MKLLHKWVAYSPRLKQIVEVVLALNPVGHHSTNWTVLDALMAAMAALTSLGTTSPRYRRQMAMYLPFPGSHLTICNRMEDAGHQNDVEPNIENLRTLSTSYPGINKVNSEAKKVKYSMMRYLLTTNGPFKNHLWHRLAL